MGDFQTKGSRLAIALAGALSLAMLGGTAKAEVDTRKFEVVADFSTFLWYSEFQKPFYAEVLPDVSGGKLTANAVPFDELGLSGFELMKLLKSGVYDIASGTLAYVTQDSPEMEGGSLGGTTPSLEAFVKVYDAYRPILDREFEEKYNAKLLAVYAWPQSLMYCNLGDRAVTADFTVLKDKKTRSFATTVSDLIEGLGGVPLTIPWAEVIPGVQRGTIDCLSSSASGAYEGKVWQVATHVFMINTNYSASYIAMNLDTWNSLSPDTQKLLSENYLDMQNRMLARSTQYEKDSIACLTTGPCPIGEIGNMTVVEPNDEDRALIKDVVENVVLKRWAERCGSQKCLDEWNETVGKIVGYTASN